MHLAGDHEHRRALLMAALPARAAATPLWMQVSTLALSLGGLGMSLYLTVAHYTTAVTLACPDTGAINCEKVTTSPQSVVFGVFPVALLGLIFYVFMAALTTPWAWRATWPGVRWARLGSLIAGIGFVVYLVYTELFTVDAICLECTTVHVITLALFALVVYASTATAEPAAARTTLVQLSGGTRQAQSPADESRLGLDGGGGGLDTGLQRPHLPERGCPHLPPDQLFQVLVSLGERRGCRSGRPRKDDSC
jgi:uncharacterized membrane protein